MLIATLFFWGGRNKMVHVPPAGLSYLKETFSKEGLLTLLPNRDGFLFHFIFLGPVGNEQRRGMDPAGGENGSALDGNQFDRGPGPDRKSNFHFDLYPDLSITLIYPAIDKVFPLTPLRKIGIGPFHYRAVFVVIIWIQGQIDSGLNRLLTGSSSPMPFSRLAKRWFRSLDWNFPYTQAPNSMKSSVMALMASHCRLG